MAIKKLFSDIKWEVKYFFRHPIASIDDWLFPFKWYKKIRGYGDFDGFHWYELSEKWGIDLDTSYIDEKYFVKNDSGIKHEDIFVNGTVNMDLLGKKLEPNKRWFEELNKHEERIKNETIKVIENAIRNLDTRDKWKEGQKIADDVRQYCRAMARCIYTERELWKAMAKMTDYNLLKYASILLEEMWT